MSTISSSERTTQRHRGAATLLFAAPLALASGAVAGLLVGQPTGAALTALAIYAAAALLILAGLPSEHSHGGLGTADRVTLLRLVVALPVPVLLLSGAPLGAAARWALVAVGTLALAMDGLDGWVARRSNSATRFGARFDMELDAALLMALSIAAWQLGPVGSWVLGIGALRYLFVVAGWFEPRLLGDLPEDQLRRKTVCVTQGVALLIVVAPLNLPLVQSLVAAASLAALLWSFGIDTLWLLGRR